MIYKYRGCIGDFLPDLFRFLTFLVKHVFNAAKKFDGVRDYHKMIVYTTYLGLFFP